MRDIKQPPKLPPTAEPLTPREVQVLGYLARGIANRQIADRLFVSFRTISTHVRNIFDKLHLIVYVAQG